MQGQSSPGFDRMTGSGSGRHDWRGIEVRRFLPHSIDNQVSEGFASWQLLIVMQWQWSILCR